MIDDHAIKNRLHIIWFDGINVALSWMHDLISCTIPLIKLSRIEHTLVCSLRKMYN